MEWSSIASKIIGMGLPILGTALLGPLGGTAAGLIAKALGLTDVTPAAIDTALSGDSAIAIQKLQTAQAEYVAMVQAEATVAGVQLKEVGDTIRSELQAVTQLGGGMGKFLTFLQVSWRPIFAYETIAECTGLAVIAAHEIWTGDFQTLNAMMQFSGFLQFYFGLKFAMLGVYSWGRTREKIEGAPDIGNAGDSTGGVVGAVIKAIRNRPQ